MTTVAKLVTRGQEVRAARLRSRTLVAVGFAVGLAVASPPVSAQGLVTYLTTRFAVEITGPGAGRLIVLGNDGNEMRSVPFAGVLPVFGPGEHYALLAASPPRIPQIEVYTASGALMGRFEIDPARSPALGRDAIVLQQRADHQPTRAFDLAFVAFDGSPLASHVREDLLLASLEALENGYWIATSQENVTEGGATWHVHLFGPRGELRWEVESSPPAPPQMAVSGDGRRAALAVSREDLTGAELRLIGAGGRAETAFEVIPFQTAVFSPDGTSLVLVGNQQLELIRASDGTRLWTASEDLLLGTGEAVLFSASSSRFYVLWQERNGDGTPGQAILAAYTVNGTSVTRIEQRLDLPTDGARLSVVDLDELADRRLRFATSSAMRSITP
jgi:hypothetical protein